MSSAYLLHIDDVYLPVDTFSENLDGLGNLNFSVSTSRIDFSASSFTSLVDIKRTMSDKILNLSITCEENVVWSSNDYLLSTANLSVGEGGASFYANFYIPEAQSEVTEINP